MCARVQMRFICVVLAFTCPTILGCGRSNSPPASSGVRRTYEKPIPDTPEAGKVRVVAQKMKEDTKTVHWKWIIVGDRCWKSTSGRIGFDNLVELTGGYPLNSTVEGVGNNAFECEFVLTLDSSTDEKTDLNYRFSLESIGMSYYSGAVSGSYGRGGTSGGGSLGFNGKLEALNEAVEVLLADDQTLPLPLEMVLVKVKGKSVKGEPIEHTFQLKASE